MNTYEQIAAGIAIALIAFCWGWELGRKRRISESTVYAAFTAQQFTRFCLTALEIPEHVQTEMIAMAAQTIIEESQVGGVEDLEQLYKR